MTAVDTALRVLRWARAEHPGPPPTGDLSEPLNLARPPAELLRSAAELAEVSCARLRLGTPPLQDDRPLTANVLLLAAALGGRHHPSSSDLVAAVPVACSASELAARHGVVGAARRACRPAEADDRTTASSATASRRPGVDVVLDALLDASPLTGILDRPGSQAMRCTALLEDVLLPTADGRNLLTLAMAAPVVSDEQSVFRGEVLRSLAIHQRSLVLDVYETAMTHHGQEHRQRVHTAMHQITVRGLPRAAATGRWWQALALIERSHRDLLRQRLGLTGYGSGIRLYWSIWRIGGFQ